MTKITEYLERHHRHCDDDFVAAENAVQQNDWQLAAVCLRRLQEQLETHFRAEENLLFPAFESASGMVNGPTDVMRIEHVQMRELLAQMDRELAAHNAETYGGLAETLLVLMQQHNMKEEDRLYPMCDQFLGQRAEGIVAELAAILHSA